MRMVVVDPMCNFAAAKAEEWVPIRVGTDAALALAMANCLVNEFGIYDAEYLQTKTNAIYLIRPNGSYARDPQSGKPLVWDEQSGTAKPYDDPAAQCAALEGEYQVAGETCQPAFALLRKHLKTYTPARGEQITGIPAATIQRLAREFGEAARVGSTIMIDGVKLPYRPASAIFFRGSQGHKNSMYNCFAIDLLNHIVGAADVVGGTLGFNPVCHGHPETGQPHYSSARGPRWADADRDLDAAAHPVSSGRATAPGFDRFNRAVPALPCVTADGFLRSGTLVAAIQTTLSPEVPAQLWCQLFDECSEIRRLWQKVLRLRLHRFLRSFP